MDVELFSRILKDLILDNDEVTLPGIGTFVCEMMPASFSDKGYTINPPYRKLSLRKREGSDNLLTEMYAASNSTDLQSASRITRDFLGELSVQLQQKKTVRLPGLGRLRATRENTVFFIPDENLDVSRHAFGLGPVSLKTKEETPEQLSEAVASLKSIIDTPALQPRLEPEPVPQPCSWMESESSPSEQPAFQSEDIARDKKRTPSVKTWIVTLLGAAVLLFGVFLLCARLAPEFTDKLLYTPDQREIIYYYEQHIQGDSYNNDAPLPSVYKSE